jgi:hypothetical protein
MKVQAAVLPTFQAKSLAEAGAVLDASSHEHGKWTTSTSAALRLRARRPIGR